MFWKGIFRWKCKKIAQEKSGQNVTISPNLVTKKTEFITKELFRKGWKALDTITIGERHQQEIIKFTFKLPSLRLVVYINVLGYLQPNERTLQKCNLN